MLKEYYHNLAVGVLNSILFETEDLPMEVDGRIRIALSLLEPDAREADIMCDFVVEAQKIVRGFSGRMDELIAHFEEGANNEPSKIEPEP